MEQGGGPIKRVIDGQFHEELDWKLYARWDLFFITFILALFFSILFFSYIPLDEIKVLFLILSILSVVGNLLVLRWYFFPITPAGPHENRDYIYIELTDDELQQLINIFSIKYGNPWYKKQNDKVADYTFKTGKFAPYPSFTYDKKRKKMIVFHSDRIAKDIIC
jgi:hypothetical protein